MAFCSKCGKYSDSSFCNRCGIRITQIDADGINNSKEYVSDTESTTRVLRYSDNSFDETIISKPDDDRFAALNKINSSHNQYYRQNKSNGSISSRNEQLSYRRKSNKRPMVDSFEQPSQKNYTKITLIIIIVTLVVAIVTVGTIFLIKNLGGNSAEINGIQVVNKGLASPDDAVEAVMLNLEQADMEGIVSLLESNYVSYFADKYHNGDVSKLVKTMNDNFYFDIVGAFESDIDLENCEWEIESVSDASDEQFRNYEDWYSEKFKVDINQVKKASVMVESNENRELIKFYVVKTNKGWYLAEALVTMHY